MLAVKKRVETTPTLSNNVHCIFIICMLLFCKLLILYQVCIIFNLYAFILLTSTIEIH